MCTNHLLIPPLCFLSSGDRVFLNDLTALDVLFNNFFSLFSSHFYIGNLFLAGLEHLDNGLVLANANASCLRNGNRADKLLLVSRDNEFPWL